MLFCFRPKNRDPRAECDCCHFPDRDSKLGGGVPKKEDTSGVEGGTVPLALGTQLGESWSSLAKLV